MLTNEQLDAQFDLVNENSARVAAECRNDDRINSQQLARSEEQSLILMGIYGELVDTRHRDVKRQAAGEPAQTDDGEPQNRERLKTSELQQQRRNRQQR